MASVSVAAIAQVLGGAAGFQTAVYSPVRLVELTRGGLPCTILITLSDELGIARTRLAGILGISERTLSRRIAAKGNLTAEESDRVVRFARVLAAAKDTFGTMEKASRWLQTPNRALEGELPFNLLDTDAGVQSVETVLGRIAFGVYS